MTSSFRDRWIAAISSLATVAALPGAAFAAELTVCPHGCEFTSIQSAGDAAHHGDVIEIEPGTYFENVQISKALTLNGAGRDKTRVDGRFLGPAVAASRSWRPPVYKHSRQIGFL